MIRLWMVLACVVLTSSPAMAQTAPDSVGVPAGQPAAPDSAAGQSAPAGTAPPAATPAAGATVAPSTAAPPPAQAPPAQTQPPAQTPPPAQAAPQTQAPPPAASAAPQTRASASGRRDPFAQGNLRLSGTVGWGQGFNSDYMIIGIGAGYYLKRGLDLGVYYENWAFGEPGVQKLSPEVRYSRVLPLGATPYVGAFYRRTFVENLDDLDSYGGRVGVYKNTAGRSMFGGGVAYEKYLDCNESVYSDCDNIYPEVVFATSF